MHLVFCFCCSTNALRIIVNGHGPVRQLSGCIHQTKSPVQLPLLDLVFGCPKKSHTGNQVFICLGHAIHGLSNLPACLGVGKFKCFFVHWAAHKKTVAIYSPLSLLSLFRKSPTPTDLIFLHGEGGWILLALFIAEKLPDDCQFSSSNLFSIRS